MAKWDHAEDTWFWDWDAKLAGKSQAGNDERVCLGVEMSVLLELHSKTVVRPGPYWGPNMLQRLMQTSRRWWGTLWTFAIYDSDNSYSFCCDKKGIGMRQCCCFLNVYFEKFVPSQGHCYPSKHCWLGRGWARPSIGNLISFDQPPGWRISWGFACKGLCSGCLCKWFAEGVWFLGNSWDSLLPEKSIEMLHLESHN